MSVLNRNANFRLPTYNMVVKLNRSYALGQNYNSSFLPESLLKIHDDGSSVKSLLYSNFRDKMSIRINSEFESSEYILRTRSEEHTSELQSRPHLVCRLLLEKKKKTKTTPNPKINKKTKPHT